MVPQGVTQEDGAFVGFNVTFTHGKHPRSITPDGMLESSLGWIISLARIGEGAALGGICKWAMVGAGAAVTKDVPGFAILIGCPAKIKGYTDKTSMR